MTGDIREFGKVLGHSFSRPDLLQAALTHPGLSGQKPAPSGEANTYERLEFLGDRVLGLVMAEWLLERFPGEKEGDIAKRHAALVRRESLDHVARAIGLLSWLRLADSGKGEGQVNRSVPGDACEAVIGALYLDGGLDVVRRFIRTWWEPLVSQASAPPVDPKTQLQEWLLARGMPLPVYEIVGRTGPDHAPVFDIRASVTGGPSATGSGTSRRDAEKLAARALFEQLESGQS